MFLNVLLVEDNVETAESFEELLIGRYLFDVKFNITLATKLSGAVSLLNENKYDVILLDLNLPDSTGVETLHELNKHKFNTPVIILTSSRDQKHIYECLKQGAQDYIIKDEIYGYVLHRAIVHSIERYNLHMNLIESKEDLKRFSYTVAHDLKNPMQNILVLAEGVRFVLESGKQGIDPELIEDLKGIEGKVHSISQMIDNLLKFSLVDEKSETFEDIKLKNCVNEAMNNLKAFIDKHKAEINLEKLEDIEIYGNPTLITQLFQNLIENSIKYRSKDQPKIQIYSRFKHKDSREEYEIYVKDNGIGIDPQHSDEVFKSFKRSDKIKKNRSIQGLGIGLATCKKIVEKHKGDIQIQNHNDVGTTFLLKFNNNNNKSSN